MITARDLIHPETTQLDRIEAQNLLILELLTKKKVSKPRASKSEYSIEFEQMWKHYPKRAGNNPKNKANSAFCARFQEEFKTGKNSAEIQQLFVDGVKRYAKYCDAMGTTGTGIVMHCSTFFGPSDPPNYTLDWKIPAPKTKTGAPEITTSSHDRVDFNKLREAEKLLMEVDRFK